MAAALALGACATPTGQALPMAAASPPAATGSFPAAGSAMPREEGWRRASLQRHVALTEPVRAVDDTQDCRRHSPQVAVADAWAVVRYGRYGRGVYRVVRLDPKRPPADMTPGAVLWINLWRCDLPAYPMHLAR